MKNNLNNKSKEKNLPLFTVFLIIFIDMLGVGIAIPVLAPLFMNTNYIFPAEVTFAFRSIILGFLIAAYPLAQFFGAPILGAWSDRVGRKKVLVVSLFGTLIGYIIFGIGVLTHNLWLLFLSRILDGFTGGNVATVLSAISDLSDEKTKVKNFGLVGMAFGLGFIIGPFVGGKLADPTLVSWFNFATPFWFAALLVTFNLLLVIFKFKETLRYSVHKKLSLLTGFRNINKAFHLPNLKTIFIVIFLIGLGFNFFTQFFSVFLIEKFEYTQSDIGSYFAFMGVCIAITQGFITRQVSKHFGPEQVLKFSLLSMGLILPLLLIPTKSHYIYFITPFIALSQGLTFPNYTAIVSKLSAKDSQGEIMGITQSISSLAMSITPLVAGFIISINLSLPIIIASFLTLLAWLIFFMFYGKVAEPLFEEE